MNRNSRGRRYPGENPPHRHSGSGLPGIPVLDDLLDGIPMGATDDEIATGKGFSETDRFQFQYELGKIRDERQWQEDMFNQYQSIPAQVRQMQEAGLNPALMYQSGASPGSMSSTGASDGSPVNSSGRTPMRAVDKASSILQMLTGVGSVAANMGKSLSDIFRNKHMNEKDDSQAALFKEQTNTEKDKQYNLAMDSLLKESQAALNNIDMTYRDTLNSLEVEKSRLEITKTWAEYQKVLSDIDVNKSVIEMNGKQVELLDKTLEIKEQELALSQIKVVMANREAMMQPEMLELQKNYLESQVLLTNAKTDTEKAAAEQARANATNALWDAMTKKKMIDVGYYEQQVKNMKTQNGVAIANCIVDGVCKVSSEALGWATFGLSKVGSNIGASSSTTFTY